MEQTAVVSLDPVYHSAIQALEPNRCNKSVASCVAPTSARIRQQGILSQLCKNSLLLGSAALVLSTLNIKIDLPTLATQLFFQPVTSAGLAALGFQAFKQRKQLWYEVSLSCLVLITMLGRQVWYSKVHPWAILGAIPLHNKAHIKALQEQGVGAVLSLVEDHEAETSSLLSAPVLQSEWQMHGIEYLRVPVSDLTAPSMEKIKRGVEFIERQATANKITYVHCKAGRGRSATLVICYLLKRHIKEIKQFSGEADVVSKAIAYVRRQRPQIFLTAAQKQAIYAYYAQECNLKRTKTT